MAGDQGEIRIGVLGTGAIAQVVHLPALSALEGVRVHALCDADRSKAASVAPRFGVERVHTDADALLSDDEIDAVLVSTPSHLHEGHAVAGLEAGKHVLVEKPLALTEAGVRRVLECAREADGVLMVALNNRHRADVEALKPLVDDGALGAVFLARTLWLNRKARRSRPTWRQRRETAGGGALMDLGVQALDLALWLLDYPDVERVVAYTHAAPGMDVEDSAVALLGLPGGATLSLEVTWSLLRRQDRHFLRLLGTEGSASLPPLAVSRDTPREGAIDATPPVPDASGNVYTTSYRRQLQRFVEAVRGERTVEPPVEQARLMRLLGLAYRSAEEGREVEA